MGFFQRFMVVVHVAAILPPVYQGSLFFMSLGIGSLVFTVQASLKHAAGQVIFQERIKRLEEDISKLPPEDRLEVTEMLNRITKRKRRR